MSLGNSTVSDFHAVRVNTPALSIMQDSIINSGDTMVEISLLSLLFGILTVLSFTSTYFLSRHGSFGASTNVRILVLSNVLIYVSTGTHIAAIIWNRVQAKQLVSGAMDGLFSPTYDGQHEMAVFEDGMRKQLVMAVFSLGIDWVMADAIVWWRACVIWRNKVVYWIGPVFLASTLGLSLSVHRTSGIRIRVSQLSDVPTVSGMIGFNRSGVVQTTGLALLEVYNPFLAAFAVLSLATNILATSFIAYKAWEHRRIVQKYFSEAGAKSQVLKVLALLVESGSVFCAFMMFIIVYYFRARLGPSPATGSSSGGLTFTKVDNYFVYGCIGPLVAIYPTFIVFLVALKQSPIDNGVLSQIYEARRPGPGAVGEGTTGSAMVFHHSTFQNASIVHIEDIGEDTGRSTGSQEMSIVEGHLKIGTLV